jgi:hypothetical protein
VAFDVLEENNSRVDCMDLGAEEGPEVAGIGFSGPFPGGTEWLAVVDNQSIGNIRLVFFNGNVVDGASIREGFV